VQNFEKWEKKCPVCNTTVNLMVPIFAADVWAVLKLPPAEKQPKANSLPELIALVEKGNFEEQAAAKSPLLAPQQKYLDVFARSAQNWVKGFADYCQRAECFGLAVDVSDLAPFPLLLSHALLSLMTGLELRGFASEMKEKAEVYHNLFIALRLSMSAEGCQPPSSEVRRSLCRQLKALLRGAGARSVNLEGLFCRVVVLFVAPRDPARGPAHHPRLSRGPQVGHAGVLRPLLHAPAAVFPGWRSRYDARDQSERGLQPRDFCDDQVLPDGHDHQVRHREPGGAQ
jgi:hypothetical protein